jgi:hypothetical protein
MVTRFIIEPEDWEAVLFVTFLHGGTASVPRLAAVSFLVEACRLGAIRYVLSGFRS